MSEKYLCDRRKSALVAVLTSVTIVSSAVAQRVDLPPTPDKAPTEETNTVTDFELDTRNMLVTVSEFEKAAAVQAMLNRIEGPAGIGARLKMSNPREELKALRVEKDQSNRWHIYFAQMYKGIPVKDGALSLHHEEGDRSPEPRWRGHYLESSEVDIVPKISKQQAIAVVEALVRSQVKPVATAAPSADAPNQALEVKEKPVCDDPRGCTETASSAVLEIHPGDGPGKRALTYHVTVKDFSGAEPIVMEAWVDNNGKILESYNNVQHACETGIGRTYYQGVASYFNIAWVPAWKLYVLNDNCLRYGTYDMYNTATTYQASSPNKTFGNHKLTDRNTTNADVHFSTVQTDSFIWWILGRDWLDGKGGPKIYQSVDGIGKLAAARNHYGVKYNNAFWNGSTVNFGDGDGKTFGPLVSLDIVAHEWAHGLNQFTVPNGPLIYKNESGALNESFSDILGAMTERYWKGESANTWKIGEQAYTPGVLGDALRYMNRPTLDGSSRDHFSQRYVGLLDNGGVHWNSGIQNNAFYLLAKGGCHRWAGCMSGSIGASAATQIFWRALRLYMVKTDGFSWARQCTLWAAEDLYGKYSFNWNRTRQAWDLVGVPKIFD